MRGYGLPRNDDVAHPDVADSQQYGLKGYKQNSRRKRVARLRWKRAARRQGKRETGKVLSLRRFS